jgi:hypothetical protein
MFFHWLWICNRALYYWWGGQVNPSKLTDFMEHSCSWEASSFSASHPTSCGTLITVLTRACHLSLLWAWRIHCMPSMPIYLRSVLILSHYLCVALRSVVLPSSFPARILYVPLLSPYVPHALPISFLLVWSLAQYLVRIIDHEARHSAVSSSPLLPCSSSLDICHSTIFLTILCPYSSFSLRDQVSYAYRTTVEIIVLCVLIFMFLERMGRQKLPTFP